MSVWKPCLVALTLTLTAGFATSAGAQGVVPGGWSPMVGYQNFGVSGGGYSGLDFGYGFPGAFYPAYGPTGIPPSVAAATAVPPSYFNTPSSQAVNALDPLMGAIRQSTRRKSRP